MKIDKLNPSRQPFILVAEDDPDQSDMLREAFEDEGYRVDTAFSGDVAIRKLYQQSYDLIILDIRMPGVSGVEVLRRLRAVRERQKQPTSDHQPPVIVVSAFVTEPEMERFRTLGADASFSKPYILDELLAASAELTARNIPPLPTRNAKTTVEPPAKERLPKS